MLQNNSLEQNFKNKIYSPLESELSKIIDSDFLGYLQYQEVLNWFSPNYLVDEFLKRSLLKSKGWKNEK